MTPRETFIRALERQPISGRVPHFELVFFLTMEAFGKVHPSHRNYGQWFQMSEHERQLHRIEMAGIYVDTARRYEHSAIFLHHPLNDLEEYQRLVDVVRAKTGDRYFLMKHGDATYSVPNGQDMMEWSAWLYERPDEVRDEAQRRVDAALERAHKLRAVVLDKTGTLTRGAPVVTDVVAAEGFTEDDLLKFAASAERGSEHPLAEALLELREPYRSAVILRRLILHPACRFFSPSVPFPKTMAGTRTHRASRDTVDHHRDL